VALRPEAAGSHNNLGSALLALHRPADAAACFMAALRLLPESPGRLGLATLAEFLAQQTGTLTVQ